MNRKLCGHHMVPLRSPMDPTLGITVMGASSQHYSSSNAKYRYFRPFYSALIPSPVSTSCPHIASAHSCPTHSPESLLQNRSLSSSSLLVSKCNPGTGNGRKGGQRGGGSAWVMEYWGLTEELTKTPKTKSRGLLRLRFNSAGPFFSP